MLVVVLMGEDAADAPPGEWSLSTSEVGIASVFEQKQSHVQSPLLKRKNRRVQ